MKLEWRRLEMFGIQVVLPILTIIAYKIREEQREIFNRLRSELGECPRCHKLFDIRAGRSFLMHLMDVHKVDFDTAEHIVRELYLKLILHKGARNGEESNRTERTNS